MAALPSNYLINKVLDATFNNTSFAGGANLYLALFTTNPDADASGTEATGSGYAREEIAFDAESSGSVVQTSNVSFSGLDSDTYTHYGIFDASTSGNLLVYGALPSSVVITSTGDSITVSDLTVNLSGS